LREDLVVVESPGNLLAMIRDNPNRVEIENRSRVKERDSGFWTALHWWCRGAVTLSVALTDDIQIPTTAWGRYGLSELFGSESLAPRSVLANLLT